MTDQSNHDIQNDSFEPRIVGFLCNWCSYAGADKAGLAQVPYPPNVRVIKVMCSGRIDPQFVLQAYREGADGVLILACHFGDCHYKEGNFRASQRHRMLLKLLKEQGIEEQRCRLDYVSASEGEKFVQVVTEMTETVKRLGPLRDKAGKNSFIKESHDGDQGTRLQGITVPATAAEDVD